MESYSVYYKGQRIGFDIPSGWKVLAVGEPKEAHAIEGIPSKLKEVLKDPIGTKSLREMASKARDAVIISDDQTRPTPVHMLLPTVLDELNGAGVPDDRISIIVGRGTHREPMGGEVVKKVGEEAMGRVSVEIHDPDNRKALSYLGISSRGTPIWINKKVAEADLRMGIGNIAPHYFAGYGGGAKIILPGVSGRETIVKNHTMITDPHTVQGKLEGNPVYADMLEIARKARLDMKIDVLLDMENRITNIIAGEVGEEHRRGIQELNKVYGFKPPRKADIVIASGHPLEENLIQSSKAAMSANLVTKEGGTIILLSGCYDGPGYQLDETLEAKPEPEEVVKWIAEGKAAPSGGPVASRMRRILKTKRVVVVTDGISPEKIERMAMVYSPTLDAAIDKVQEEKEDADVIILPAGSSINPLI
jgi:nickel-dependent lactate racemase